MTEEVQTTNIKDIVREAGLTLWKYKRAFVIMNVVTVLVIIGVALLMQDEYSSTAIILPNVERNNINLLSGLSSIASAVGVGDVRQEDLFEDIINSESVMKATIFSRFKTPAFPDSATLLQIWKIPEETPEPLKLELAFAKLQKAIDVRQDRTRITKVTVTTSDAQLSADIANTILRSLDRFLRSQRRTGVTLQRKFIESRIEELESELEKAENNLKTFRSMNRRLVDSPELQLEQERLMRQVQVHATIFIEMRRQYEIIKIEEQKNSPVINVMDQARKAGLRSAPNRRNIVIIGTIFSAVFYLGLFAFMNRIKPFFTNPTQWVRSFFQQ